MNRITRDEMLMEVAHVVAKRGTCSRLQVGAVFALEGRILVTGYNGAPRGMDHCTHESYTWWYKADWASDPEVPWSEVPEWLRSFLANNEDYEPQINQVFHWDGQTIRTNWATGARQPADPGCGVAEHAERNAIYWAANQGITLGGSEVFVTHQPCYDCARALVALDVRRVIFSTSYRKPQGLALLLSRGIEVVDLSAPREV